jgi:2-polyprenyl-3-methyl-5-hydroxy-6-metoxy-1,4-benzoquinol methylase
MLNEEELPMMNEEESPMMNEEELTAKVESLKPWISYFELAPGVKTLSAPDWRVPRGEIFMKVLSDIYGGSLAEKTVFDIGCNAGGMSFDALKSGAKSCHGIDGRPNYIEQANFLKTHLSVSDDQAQFSVSNLYDVNVEKFGKFSITLFCGVLYYLTKPVDVFDKLAEMTEDIILVDSRSNLKNDISMNMVSVDPDNPRVGLEALGFETSVRGCVKLMQNAGFDDVILVDMVKLIPRDILRNDEALTAHADWPFAYYRGLRVTLIGFKSKNLYEDFIQKHSNIVLESFRRSDKNLLPLRFRIAYRVEKLFQFIRFKVHVLFRS